MVDFPFIFRSKIYWPKVKKTLDVFGSRGLPRESSNPTQTISIVLGLVVDKDLYDQFYNLLSYLSGSDSNSDMTATYSLLQRRQRRGDSAKGQSPQYYYPQHHL